MTTSTIRSTVLTLAALAVGVGGVVATTSATNAEPDGAATTRPAAAETVTAPIDVAAGHTALTFTVEDCEDCEIQLHQGFPAKPRPTVWDSEVKTVEDGAVTFVVPSSRTWGMTATVAAPWEGHTGYDTTVVFRYDGKGVGEPVTLEEAVAAEAATGCWAGTRSPEVTIPLVVEEVEVAGVQERVPGSIAYTPTTEDWTAEVRTVWDGVLGSQDLDLCGQA